MLCISWNMDHGLQCMSEGPIMLPAVAYLSQGIIYTWASDYYYICYYYFPLCHFPVHIHFIIQRDNFPVLEKLKRFEQTKLKMYGFLVSVSHTRWFATIST